MLYKEIPFLRYTIPLIIGIVIGSFIDDLSHGLMLMLVAASTGFVIASMFTSDRRQNLLFGIAIFQFLLITGLSLYSIKYSNIAGSSAGPAIYMVRVDNFPVKRDRSVKMPVTVLEEKRPGKYLKTNKMMLYFPPSSSVSLAEPGDILSLELSPRIIDDFNLDDNFDYSRYMMFRGYRYYAFAHDFNYYGSKCKGLKHLGLIIQHILVKKYSSGINNSRSLEIVSALTLGYREVISEEVRTRFRDAGISHIMAVSGLHVGILSIIVLTILQLFRIKSGPAPLVATVIIIWLFALISGLTPSVTRASLMFTFLYTGKFIQRNVNPLNSLFASAFILMIANPFVLFAAGFQLSYSAVLFILLFYKKLDNLVNLSGVLLRKTWSLISVTILAQAGTLPFVIYHFRKVPLLSLLSNIFAIPLAFLILVTGFAYLGTPESIFLSRLLARLIEVETELLYSITDWIASFTL